MSVVAVLLLAAACASAGSQVDPEAAPPQPADPAIALAVTEATELERPLQVTFDWTLEERDARFTGRGV
ncbi:MAG: hypothetical protein ACRELX_10895, partial [Longimicrobiales bacterium]